MSQKKEIGLKKMNKLRDMKPVEPQKGYFWMIVCILLGFVVGALIEQYIMGPVVGLCVGVLIDEGVYKVRMKRFVAKGGVPSAPPKQDQK
ncbi:YoaK family protein [Anaeromassilibacillus senegalensis]|uniref:hypothetical protein n=1 Tax=Anaeromassilibacillus senegalensis TaxID=1673717 RepID=UPI00068007EC|nr:hypothetical protein [Anaeromassilibacillus senegalensis]